MTTNTTSSLISVDDAAKLTGRHPKTVRRWIREGLLPAKKLGRSYQINPSDLWVEYVPTKKAAQA